MEMALLPFAMGFGIDFYIIGEKSSGRWLGTVLGLGSASPSIANITGPFGFSRPNGEKLDLPIPVW